MSKSLKVLIAAGALAVMIGPGSAEGDPDAGAKVFRKCAACHAVGENARNKVGPQLNDVFGRTAGGLDGYKYSKAMIAAGEEGLVWSHETIAEYLAKPRDFIPKNKMAFAGLRKDDEIENVLAYLATFSTGAAEAPASDDEAAAEPAAEEAATASADQATPASAGSSTRDGGVFGLGRAALPEEVAAWDIDIRPDGEGLPDGRGTVAEGEVVFTEQCAVCHGDFGEGVGRWPVLAGGFDTLTRERPEKTVGSYWPYLSTVYDYVRRAMPFGNARSLSDDDVYALTAYILYLNDIVTEEDFELSKENFADIEMPNAANFVDDDRPQEAHYAGKGEPCMTNCKPEPAEITMRARILDVTPGSVDDDAAAAGGGVD